MGIYLGCFAQVDHITTTVNGITAVQYTHAPPTKSIPTPTTNTMIVTLERFPEEHRRMASRSSSSIPVPYSRFVIPDFPVPVLLDRERR